MGVTASQHLRHRVGTFLRRPGAAVLLDLDGTLVDSEPMQRAAFAAYFASRGWDVPDHVIRRFMGRRGYESFALIDGPWRGEDPVTLTEGVIAHVDPAANPPVPVPGAADAIRGWREQGLPVALVTSAFRDWAELALQLLGVADLGLRLVTAEDTPVGKPEPYPFLLGAERLGVATTACLAAEDSLAGLTSARTAGVGFVVGVTTSLGVDELAAAGADAVVADLTELAPRD